MAKFRQGITTGLPKYDYLRGRIHAEEMLEGLGIDVGYRLGPNQIMCHCPDLEGNHKNGDANPSFGYNEEKMAYNCFVCGGGNVVELVQAMLGVSEDEAFKYLESYSDLEPSTSDDLLQRLERTMNPVKEEPSLPDFPIDTLQRFRKIHPYLYERGITRDVIVDMQIGFDDEHTGIIIPHFHQGKLVGWQIRHLAEEKGKFLCQKEECNKYDAVPKYKNVPARGFPKSTTLYGYDKLKEAVNRIGVSQAIVVESPMTALYLMSHGIENVAATFGQFSEAQGMLLIPFEEVLFWPDNDDAGRSNTERAIAVLSRYTKLMLVPVAPGEKSDAANLDPEELKEYIQGSYPASLYPVKGLHEGLDL